MSGISGDKLRLQHIQLAIQEIHSYTAGVDKESFISNSMMFNATLRQLEIIGEAANHVSSELMLLHPDIPWARIIGLRNLIIHEYFGVDDLSIWSILQHNLPVLRRRIDEILAEL